MTKLVSLRVTLAVDDTVDMKELKPRLAALIAERGTESIDDLGGRVHWGTAEVLQGPERVIRGGRSRRGAAVVAQSELLAS